MIIQNIDNKITVVSMHNELLPIHEELGYELMELPSGMTEMDIRGKKLKLDDNGNLVIDTELMDELANKQRIKDIKAKAKELITEKYPLYKQNNILMSGNMDDIRAMNDYIDGIRSVSNKAEIDKIKLEDINWS